jgi:hypothetical protein
MELQLTIMDIILFGIFIAILGVAYEIQNLRDVLKKQKKNTHVSFGKGKKWST